MRFAPPTLRSRAARRFGEPFPPGSRSARSQSYPDLRPASQPDCPLPDEPAAADGHREGVGDDEDADAPGKGDPDVGAHRLPDQSKSDSPPKQRYRSAPGRTMERQVMSVQASEPIPIRAQQDRRLSDAPERGATAEVTATPDLGGVG